MATSTSTLAVNGEQIGLHQAGRPGRPAVFFFHSLGLSGALWAPQFAAFEDAYHLIAMDCRGHGASSNHGGFSVQACVDDALALWRALGLSRAHVVGISMGGLMAARLAERLQAQGAGLHCDSVTLACSYRCADGAQTQARIDATAARIHDEGMAAFARFYMDGTACVHLDADLRARMAQAIAAMQPQDYLQTLAEILRHDAGPALASLQGLPVQVLSGALDQRVSAQALQDLLSALPQARSTVLARAGHLANIEDPAGFNRALRSFWDAC